MPFQTLAAVATILSFAPQGNRVEFKMDHGGAELTWFSPGAFRFRRTLEGPLPAATWAGAGAVDVKIEELPGSVRLRSKSIEVTVQKRGALVSVRRLSGEPLMSDSTEPRADKGAVTWERVMRPDVRYYGLGRRTDMSFDWRGKAGDADTPLLISTSGYGEFHAATGAYRFDFTAPDRYRITAPRVDYYFYYGPRPKRIFEERNDMPGPATQVLPPTAEAPSWQALRNEVLRLVHGAMSGMLSQPFDLGAYAKAPPDLLARARQVGSLVEDVKAPPAQLSDFRAQLNTFFASYETERRDRGYPLWHPLPFQYPDDPECALHADEFMLGDEMLVAPILDASGKRSLYLPPGVWTSLETNEVFQGRQSIAVASKALPVYARNGTILPLDSPGGMALHYFPTLPAEFFVLEPEAQEWTQIHAAPAADIFRLEIAAKTARDYQWVIHHVERPSRVGFERTEYSSAESLTELAPRTWFYDAPRKNLHVRVSVAAGETNIIHIAW